MGSWVSKLQGPVNSAGPPNVALMYQTGNRTWGEPGTGGYLGVAHNPFNLVGKKARTSADSMVLQGISLDRLRDRKRLMAGFDQFRRAVDNKGTMESMDVYMQQAMGILTDSALANALDLSKEDPAVVAKYGKSIEKFQRDGAPKMIENFCIARRLIEAGARVVSLNYSRWDCPLVEKTYHIHAAVRRFRRTHWAPNRRISRAFRIVDECSPTG